MALEVLRTLQQELSEAIQNGDLEAIRNLTQALQTALQQYLKALQRHALQQLDESTRPSTTSTLE